jgi:hypothetical protein
VPSDPSGSAQAGPGDDGYGAEGRRAPDQRSQFFPGLRPAWRHRSPPEAGRPSHASRPRAAGRAQGGTSPMEGPAGNARKSPPLKDDGFGRAPSPSEGLTPARLLAGTQMTSGSTGPPPRPVPPKMNLPRGGGPRRRGRDRAEAQGPHREEGILSSASPAPSRSRP